MSFSVHASICSICTLCSQLMTMAQISHMHLEGMCLADGPNWGGALVMDIVHISIQRLPVQQSVGPVKPGIMYVVHDQNTKGHVEHVAHACGLVAGIEFAPPCGVQPLTHSPHPCLDCYRP